MSFNIRFQQHDHLKGADGQLHPWDERKHLVLGTVRDMTPDVAGFQEVQDDQQDYLTRNLVSYEAHSSGRVGELLDQTFLIMWRRDRFESVDAGSTRVPGPPPHNRRAMAWVRLRSSQTSRDLFVFNTHFPPGREEAEKVELCRLVADVIGRTAAPDAPAILLGDLNIRDADSDGIGILRREAGLVDPWTDTGTAQESAWQGWPPSREPRPTVDWVLYRRPMRALEVERPHPRDHETAPSDHLPVCVFLDTGME